VFRELVDALGRDGAIREFRLISHSMENPAGDDERFHFAFAANGLPGKTAQVTLNLTRLLREKGVRDQSSRIVPILVLAVQENLEAGAYRELDEGNLDFLTVEIGEGI
jgi:hypothetical protein